jgi:hypothetical protein
VSAAEPGELERIAKFNIAHVFRKASFDISELAARVDEVLKQESLRDE